MNTLLLWIIIMWCLLISYKITRVEINRKTEHAEIMELLKKSKISHLNKENMTLRALLKEAEISLNCPVVRWQQECTQRKIRAFFGGPNSAAARAIAETDGLKNKVDGSSSSRPTKK